MRVLAGLTGALCRLPRSLTASNSTMISKIQGGARFIHVRPPPKSLDPRHKAVAPHVPCCQHSKKVDAEEAELPYGPAPPHPTSSDLDKVISKMLEGNKAWADEMNRTNPAFFQQLQKGQRPHTLWIGCSDSRVPANEVTGTGSGEIFVHRNIANTVIHSDASFLSVLQFAVDVLDVKHIVVCGHQHCGGVTAALANKSFGIVDNWLRHIQNTYLLHRDELDAIEDFDQRVTRMTELHVQESVLNVCKNNVIHQKWKTLRKEGKLEYPQVHGWVYSLETGLIKNTLTVQGYEELKRLSAHPKSLSKAS